MTKDQKEWIDSHADEGYRMIGMSGGPARWTKRGFVLPDGTFQPRRSSAPVPKGAVEVGVLEIVEPGKMPVGFPGGNAR